MLSRPVSRCAHHTPPLHLPSLYCRCPSAPTLLALNTRPQHRRSSSKTSAPPGGSNPASGPRSHAQTTPATRTLLAEPDSDITDKRRLPASSVGRRKSKGQEANPEDLALKARHAAFASIPAVPPTTHLALEDVKLSSLFAMDRPISVTKTGYPPYVDSKRFNSIFEPRTNVHRIEDTTYTLTSAISALDSATTHSSQNPTRDSIQSSDDLYNDLLQTSSSSNNGVGTIHLDNAPSLEQLTKQYRPFLKPPPPIPLGDASAVRAEAERRAATRAKEAKQATDATERNRSRKKKKTFTTTLTIEERTDGRGEKTYSASASPILEQHTEATAEVHIGEATSTEPSKKQQRRTSRQDVERTITLSRQPFLSRMRAREAAQLRDLEDHFEQYHQASGVKSTQEPVPSDQESLDAPATASGNSLALKTEATLTRNPAFRRPRRQDNVAREMLLISVKRQRKLKMKKHKYKKLMRRTRNLRRREGRN